MSLSKETPLQTKIMEALRKQSQESANPHSFCEGYVFAMGQASAFNEQLSKENVQKMIDVILDQVDEHHFKRNQQ